MSRYRFALLGVVAGLVSVVAGVLLAFGLGLALIVGGAAVVSASFLLINVDKESDGEPSPTPP